MRQNLKFYYVGMEINRLFKVGVRVHKIADARVGVGRYISMC